MQIKEKRHKPEEIPRLVAQVDAAIASGLTVEEACRNAGISPSTYRRWRQKTAKRTAEGLQSNDQRILELLSEVSGQLLRLASIVESLAVSIERQNSAKAGPG